MIGKILSFFQSRRVPVEFRNLVGHSIDTSLFDSVSHHRIHGDGFFECSPAELLHAASTHFQGRYRNSRSLQWLNACHEVLPSLQPASAGNPFLCLNSKESSEFQVKSTEVIAVGLGLALSRRLFRIRYQDISTIEITTKRCDFAFQKNALSYVLETRGRKRDAQITPAIDEVFEKKEHHSGAKYGFVSHLPREGQPSSVIVVDPPVDPQPLEEWDRVARLLRYYSSAARLSGFWRLSDLMNERANGLREMKSLARFDRRPLEFGNIEKLGHPIEVSMAGYSFQLFVARNESPEGLFSFEGFAFVVGIVPELFRILEAQDFDRLLDFRLPTPTEAPIRDNIGANVSDDGTIFAAVPISRLNGVVG